MNVIVIDGNCIWESMPKISWKGATMYRRQKYFNVRLNDPNAFFNPASFESCRDAAIWLVDMGWSKSIGAARVGMSTVLTGKRATYRHFVVDAERRI